MNKVFALLFSFYILTLSCMPCHDKDDCESSNANPSTLITTNHTSDSNETGCCSPFCVCACCGQSYNFTPLQISLGFSFPVSSQKIAVYQASFVSEVFISIWQPPKIC